jgi:hypothetical protein
MSIEEAVLEKLRDLSEEKQREVLNFIKSLQKKARGKGPKRGVRGLWADLNMSISEKDIDEARRELWKNFPREDI